MLCEGADAALSMHVEESPSSISLGYAKRVTSVHLKLGDGETGAMTVG